jgi:hypothetical protein
VVPCEYALLSICCCLFVCFFVSHHKEGRLILFAMIGFSIVKAGVAPAYAPCRLYSYKVGASTLPMWPLISFLNVEHTRPLRVY